MFNARLAVSFLLCAQVATVINCRADELPPPEQDPKLLALVDPILHWRVRHVPDEQNAWPLWIKAAAIAVETEAWRERDDGSVRVDQVLYVRRDSQKSIVLGKDGRRIKAIGSAARYELQEILGRSVHLFIHVKVRDDWQDNPERYRDIGLNFDV